MVDPNTSSTFSMATEADLELAYKRRYAQRELEDLVYRKASPSYQITDKEALDEKRRIRDTYGDVAELIEIEMAADSRIDFLTGLFNRIGLIGPLSREIELLNEIETSKKPTSGSEKRRFSDTQEEYVQEREVEEKTKGRRSFLIMIDLDRFKPINDDYGHEAGDEALKAVSRMLEEKFRTTDTICRYGGDEFLLLVQDLAPDDMHGKNEQEDPIEAVTNKLQKELDDFSFEYNGQEISLGGTIGVFEVKPELSASDNIKLVDDKMMAKKAHNPRGRPEASEADSAFNGMSVAPLPWVPQ